MFVGIYRGIDSFQSFSGGAKWISSIHSRTSSRFVFESVKGQPFGAVTKSGSTRGSQKVKRSAGDK